MNDLRAIINLIDKIQSRQLLLEGSPSDPDEYWYLKPDTPPQTGTAGPSHPGLSDKENTIVQQLNQLYDQIESYLLTHQASGESLTKHITGSISEQLLHDFGYATLIEANNPSIGQRIGSGLFKWLGIPANIAYTGSVAWDKIQALDPKLSKEQRNIEIAKIISGLVAELGVMWAGFVIGAAIGIIGGPVVSAITGVLGSVGMGLLVDDRDKELTDAIVEAVVDYLDYGESLGGYTLAPGGNKDLAELQQELKSAYPNLKITVNGLPDKETIIGIQTDLNTKFNAKLPITGTIDTDTVIAIKRHYLKETPTSVNESIQLNEWGTRDLRAWLIRRLRASRRPAPPPPPNRPGFVKRNVIDNPYKWKALIATGILGSALYYSPEIKQAARDVGKADPRATGGQAVVATPTQATDTSAKPSTAVDATKKTKAVASKPPTQISPELRSLIKRADDLLIGLKKYTNPQVRNAMERLDMLIQSIPQVKVGGRRGAIWSIQSK